MREIIEAITVTAEIVGDEPRPTSVAAMAMDLSRYPAQRVMDALVLCRRELKGRLTLASIIERIDDGHPPVNEGWAIAVRAADERNTIAWTQEIAESWAVAQPLMEVGDKVAARMAFMEAYGERLRQSRRNFQVAQFFLCLGYDQSDRVRAAREAVESGKLSRDAVDPQLLSHEQAPAFDAVALIGGRVEVTPSCPEATRERLAKVMDAIRGVDA